MRKIYMKLFRIWACSYGGDVVYSFLVLVAVMFCGVVTFEQFWKWTLWEKPT